MKVLIIYNTLNSTKAVLQHPNPNRYNAGTAGVCGCEGALETTPLYPALFSILQSTLQTGVKKEDNPRQKSAKLALLFAGWGQHPYSGD